MLLILACLLAGTEVPSPQQLELEQLGIAMEPADRSEYILGAGDVLVVVIEGGTSMSSLTAGLMPQSICTVGSDGCVSVSGIGQLEVAGLSIDEAAATLEALSRRFFPGSPAHLSLLQPRLVRVRAAGMVERPGTYTMYALQRVSDLVDLCGGLTSFASHTGWMYSGGDSARVDLMLDPATHAPAADPLVAEGATVVFDACTYPVFVVRPPETTDRTLPPIAAMYAWDVPRPVPLEYFLETTGGSGGNIDLSRSELRRGGESHPLWTAGGLAELEVQAGDTLLFTGVENSVHVGGAVNYPASIAWRSSFTLLDYIALAGGLTVGGDIDRVTLSRQGTPLADGEDAWGMKPQPGDVIEVPYTWLHRNAEAISLFSAIVSLAALVSSLTR